MVILYYTILITNTNTNTILLMDYYTNTGLTHLIKYAFIYLSGWSRGKWRCFISVTKLERLLKKYLINATLLTSIYILTLAHSYTTVRYTQ